MRGTRLSEVAIEERFVCIELGGHTMKASVPSRLGLFSAAMCIGLVFCALAQDVSMAAGSAGGRPEGAYYAGESLRVGQREIPLFRSREKVAVLHGDSREIAAAAIPDVIRAGDRSYRIERRISKAKATILTTRKFQSLEEQTESLRRLQEQADLGDVVPVYVHGISGLEVIPTGNVIVKLAAGYFEPEVAAMNQRLGTRLERRIRGTDDQYVLSAGHSTAEELFAVCATLAADPAVEWVEPEFTGEVARPAFTPNDPLFDPNQWHLKDINAPQAWDIVRGSDEVIIAIIDDGVETDHEDLKDALPCNTREISGDAKDNDLNGWQDDCNGWDFYDNDNNPSPSDADETHGTQVAGVALASGNNGKGVVGGAFGCRLMPLKVLKAGAELMATDILYPAVAEAIYYAAGRTANGTGTWRGADVISMSLGFSETNITNSALAYAARKGRGGKGCPVLCAAGNDAMGWYAVDVSQLEKGTYDFRWEYIKSATGSAGQDTVWLDAVVWPDGSIERFKGQTLPTGWSTGGDAPWISVQDEVDGNHALIGRDKEDVRSVRAGPIRDRGRSFLATTQTLTEGDMEFWLWPSSEESYSCQVGQYDLVDWGFGQSVWPFSPTGAKYRRMQFICLREELGWDEYEPLPARPLRFAEFYLVDPPRQRLAALTIRLKQIPNGRNAYYQPTWDNTGWTTVLQAKNVPLNVGTAFELDYATMVNLVRFDFTQEFMYDPAYNLAVDISISASGTDYGGLCMLWMADQTRAIIGEETSGSSQPTDWSGSQGNAEVTQSVPLMWLGSGDEVRFFVDWILARKFSGIR
ncbi:MAG: hypothetical protein EHM35_03480, partial [Planctomycetaceae bacterium]